MDRYIHQYNFFTEQKNIIIHNLPNIVHNKDFYHHTITLIH